MRIRTEASHVAAQLRVGLTESLTDLEPLGRLDLSRNHMENALFVALGWLAGILSSLVLEWNRERRIAKSLRTALLFELAEFRFRMAGVAFMLGARSGTFTPDRISWLIGEFESYKGFASPKDVLEALRAMQEHPEEAQRVAKHFAAQASQASPGLKKYPTPALDAAVAAVSLFKPAEQRQILELRTLVSNLESATDEAWRFFEKTFDSSLTANDRRRIDVNLETAYAQSAQICERIAKHASQFVGAA